MNLRRLPHDFSAKDIPELLDLLGLAMPFGSASLAASGQPLSRSGYKISERTLDAALAKTEFQNADAILIKLTLQQNGLLGADRLVAGAR